jgi:hypothetical protein
VGGEGADGRQSCLISPSRTSPARPGSIPDDAEDVLAPHPALRPRRRGGARPARVPDASRPRSSASTRSTRPSSTATSTDVERRNLGSHRQGPRRSSSRTSIDVRPGDPEASRAPQRATSPTSTTSSIAITPGRLRHQGRRQVQRRRQRQVACSGSTSTSQLAQRMLKRSEGQGVHQRQAPQNAQWLIRAIEQRQAHDHQGHRVHRREAARLPREGRRLPQADDPARRGRGGGHARVHDLARHEQQVRAHAPQGFFELKYFFNSEHLARDNEDDIASESVKQAIKKIIAAEKTRQNPHSAISAIVKMLEDRTASRSPDAPWPSTERCWASSPRAKRKKLF